MDNIKVHLMYCKALECKMTQFACDARKKLIKEQREDDGTRKRGWKKKTILIGVEKCLECKDGLIELNKCQITGVTKEENKVKTCKKCGEEKGLYCFDSGRNFCILCIEKRKEEKKMNDNETSQDFDLSADDLKSNELTIIQPKTAEIKSSPKKARKKQVRWSNKIIRIFDEQKGVDLSPSYIKEHLITEGYEQLNHSRGRNIIHKSLTGLLNKGVIEKTGTGLYHRKQRIIQPKAPEISFTDEILTLDFSLVNGLKGKLEKAAIKDVRTIEHQALFIIKEALENKND